MKLNDGKIWTTYQNIMTDQANPPAGGNPPPPPPPPPAGGDAAKASKKVVRPGDAVPDGGLDPTDVFSTPPPPPPAAAGGKAAKGDPAAAGGGTQPPPPQDQGPPPPPLGTVATAEMGFDEEDIRVLTEVGDYRFGSVTSQMTNENINIPDHPETTFDEQEFLTLLRGSISLTRDEKWRIVQAAPKLSQFQIDELKKILDEERKKFSDLSPKHLLQLMKLEQKHAQDWADLQSVTLQQSAQEGEKEEAEEIRKQLGL